jgi:hypothetical protein
VQELRGQVGRQLIAAGVLFDAEIEIGGLEPLNGNGNVRNRAEDNFGIQILFEAKEKEEEMIKKKKKERRKFSKRSLTSTSEASRLEERDVSAFCVKGEGFAFDGMFPLTCFRSSFGVQPSFCIFRDFALA